MRFALLALPLLAIAAPAAAQTLVGPHHTGNAAPDMYGMPPHSGMPMSASGPGYSASSASIERIAEDRIVLDLKGYRIGKIDAVDAGGAVIRHANGLTRVPLEAIVVDGWGVLRMNVSARKFAQKASPDS